jgi:hypothetical protein
MIILSFSEKNWQDFYFYAYGKKYMNINQKDKKSCIYSLRIEFFYKIGVI